MSDKGILLQAPWNCSEKSGTWGLFNVFKREFCLYQKSKGDCGNAAVAFALTKEISSA